MSFLYKLLTREFNFIIPVSYMILGVVFAAVIALIRYTLYMKRKRHFKNKPDVWIDQDTAKKEVL